MDCWHYLDMLLIFVSAPPAVPTAVRKTLHGLAEWARHARTEPSEAAELWYRGTVGPIARVYGSMAPEEPA